MSRLILASSSLARTRMMERAGILFEREASYVDEAALRSALVQEGAGPRDLADALAEAKTMKVAVRHPDALIIGADQILDMEGEIFAKPATPQELTEQLLRLSGKQHRLLSAAVVAEGGKPVWRHVGEARLHVRKMSKDWMDDYVDRNWERVRGSVGGYVIEEEGVRLFDRIDGDIFTIMGLPLIPLLSWLTLRGSIPG